MQGPWLRLPWTLNGQVDGVAGMPAAVSIIERSGSEERLAVDRHNAVADSETCMLGTAAAHDVENRNRARAPIIRTCGGRFVEAQLDSRARVTHVVHPDRAVENRSGRQERGQCCEELTWECRPGAHKRAGTERRVSRVAAYDDRSGESIKTLWRGRRPPREWNSR